MAKTISIHIWIIFGYLLIILLIGGIAYTWNYEWQKVESLESDNRQIDILQKKVNDIQIHLIEFLLLGETVLEWNDKDLEHYHIQRLIMDSMLYHFKTIYPAERIDSVRYLLEDKEQQMRRIVHTLGEQQALSEKIAYQVPAIVKKVYKNSPINQNEKDSWVSSGRKRKQNRL